MTAEAVLGSEKKEETQAMQEVDGEKGEVA